MGKMIENNNHRNDTKMGEENQIVNKEAEKESILISWSKSFFFNKDNEIRVECLGVALAIIFFVCRAFWYIYISGKFAAYKINDIYIEVSSENIVFKTILSMAFIGIILLSNYLCYYVIISYDLLRYRLLYLFLINISVSIGFSIAMFLNGSLEGFPFGVLNVLVFIILLTFFSNIINLYGIMLGFLERFEKWKAQRLARNEEKLPKEQRKGKRENENAKKKEKINSTKKNLVVTFLSGVLIFQILITYLVGYYDALGTKIYETINNEYVILYEDKDNYIVAKYTEENGGIKEINYDLKKVISKMDKEIVKKNVITNKD